MESREEFTKRYKEMHKSNMGRNRPMNEIDKMRLRVMTEADQVEKNTKEELETLVDDVKNKNSDAAAKFFGILADRKKSE